MKFKINQIKPNIKPILFILLLACTSAFAEPTQKLCKEAEKIISTETTEEMKKFITQKLHPQGFDINSFHCNIIDTIDMPGLSRATLLNLAVRECKDKMTHFLLSMGADINGKVSPEDLRTDTPLIMALTALRHTSLFGEPSPTEENEFKNKCKKIVQLLLENKADVNLYSPNADTYPLHSTFSPLNLDVASLLMKYEPNIYQLDREQNTTLTSIRIRKRIVLQRPKSHSLKILEIAKIEAQLRYLEYKKYIEDRNLIDFFTTNSLPLEASGITAQYLTPSDFIFSKNQTPSFIILPPTSPDKPSLPKMTANEMNFSFKAAFSNAILQNNVEEMKRLIISFYNSNNKNGDEYGEKHDLKKNLNSFTPEKGESENLLFELAFHQYDLATQKYDPINLCYSISDENTEMLRVLIQSGLSFDFMSNRERKTLVQLAIERGDVKFLQFLVNSGADPIMGHPINTQAATTPYLHSAMNNSELPFSTRLELATVLTQNRFDILANSATTPGTINVNLVLFKQFKKEYPLEPESIEKIDALIQRTKEIARMKTERDTAIAVTAHKRVQQVFEANIKNLPEDIAKLNKQRAQDASFASPRINNNLYTTH